MNTLEEQIIDLLVPFFGDNKSKQKLAKVLTDLNIVQGTLEESNLTQVAKKLEESCKNLGPNTAASIKERVLKLS